MKTPKPANMADRRLTHSRAYTGAGCHGRTAWATAEDAGRAGGGVSAAVRQRRRWPPWGLTLGRRVSRGIQGGPGRRKAGHGPSPPSSGQNVTPRQGKPLPRRTPTGRPPSAASLLNRRRKSTHQCPLSSHLDRNAPRPPLPAPFPPSASYCPYPSPSRRTTVSRRIKPVPHAARHSV